MSTTTDATASRRRNELNARGTKPDPGCVWHWNELKAGSTNPDPARILALNRLKARGTNQIRPEYWR